MKKLFQLLCVSSVLICGLATARAQAPTYYPYTIVASNSATCAATAGTNVNKVIPCGKQASVALQIELMADATGAYVFTVPIQYSMDGAIYSGMAPNSIAISFNGVTKQTIVTNVPTWGAGFLKIPYLTNATASINVTNIIIKSADKISAP